MQARKLIARDGVLGLKVENSPVVCESGVLVSCVFGHLAQSTKC